MGALDAIAPAPRPVASRSVADGTLEMDLHHARMLPPVHKARGGDWPNKTHAQIDRLQDLYLRSMVVKEVVGLEYWYQ